MDYLPYEMHKLHIIIRLLLVVLAKIFGQPSREFSKSYCSQAEPLIVSAVKHFGSPSPGNVYERDNVDLFIDDGRHYSLSARQIPNMMQ